MFFNKYLENITFASFITATHQFPPTFK